MSTEGEMWGRHLNCQEELDDQCHWMVYHVVRTQLSSSLDVGLEHIICLRTFHSFINLENIC